MLSNYIIMSHIFPSPIEWVTKTPLADEYFLLFLMIAS